MADIQCGQFVQKPIPGGAMTRYSAILTPPPDSTWRKAFDSEVTMARQVGTFLADVQLFGDTIEFSAEDTSARAIESAICDIIRGINSVTARPEAAGGGWAGDALRPN